MKLDILMLCILATILCSTRHVIGFLTSQDTAKNAAAAEAGLQQRLAPLGGFANKPQHFMPDSRERAVYDPGDELLHALNAELAASGQELGTSPEQPDYADTVYNELEVASKYDMLKKLEEDLRAEQELVDKSALLMKMLEDPTLDTLPLVYMEETPTAGEDYAELEDAGPQTVLSHKAKRTRYYRRYPWKRHSRNRGSYMHSINSNYEPELRYACTPSKEDIFKLLVNLHENRKGNHSKTVNFCNRKRPAKAVFTNIRFLG